MSAGRRVRDHVRAGGRVFTYLFERVISWTIGTATLARIMRIAHETNAELPGLSASMPPSYAYFANAHRTVHPHSDDAPDS